MLFTECLHKNDRMRSVRAGRALTEKYNLYLAPGKDNVNRQRLRDPDSVKYAIYDAVKAALPQSKSWGELERRLERQGIAVTFKYSGGTDTRQGVIFGKDGFSLTCEKRTSLSFAPRHRERAPVLSACRKFNGSKVDRAFSFSKLDATLNGNSQRERRETAARETQNPTAQQTRTAPTPMREARSSPMHETRNTQDITPTFTQTFSPSPQPEPAHYSAHLHTDSSNGGMLSVLTPDIRGVSGLLGVFDLEPNGDSGGAPPPKKKKKKQYKPSL